MRPDLHYNYVQLVPRILRIADPASGVLIVRTHAMIVTNEREIRLLDLTPHNVQGWPQDVRIAECCEGNDVRRPKPPDLCEAAVMIETDVQRDLPARFGDTIQFARERVTSRRRVLE